MEDRFVDQSLNTVVLQTPYVLFLGEETNPLKAKTALGLRDWAPAHRLV